MSPLIFETIRWAQGAPEALDWHQRRLDLSLRRLGVVSSPNLADFLARHPGPTDDAVYKCHIGVTADGTLLAPHFDLYHPRHIERLICVEVPDLDYSLKWENRQSLQSLSNNPELANILHPSDELIITQHGKLTDTRYSNLAFFDGSSWITPTSYLLPGTRRARLLHQGLLQERPLTVADLPSFQSASLINSMLTIGEITCSTIL